MYISLRAVTLLVCLAVSACGSKSPSPAAPSTPATPAPAGPTLQSVRLQPTGNPGPWYAPGGTNQTIAVGTFSDGTTQNITTSCTDWQSDNTFVLTISNEGLLTAHNSGSATITTTCQGVFARGLVPLNVMPTTPWSRSGTGPVPFFEVPPYVGRLRITAQSTGTTHFAVLADGLLLVARDMQRNVPYEGTHAVRLTTRAFVSGQVVDTRNATTWTLTEVR